MPADSRRSYAATGPWAGMVTVDTEQVAVEESPELVTLELARPAKLNALTPPMVRGLASAFEQLEGDRGRAVLLTGQGRAMCAGMDEDIVGDERMPTTEVSRSVSASLGHVAFFGRERSARRVAAVVSSIVLDEANWVEAASPARSRGPRQN